MAIKTLSRTTNVSRGKRQIAREGLVLLSLLFVLLIIEIIPEDSFIIYSRKLELEKGEQKQHIYCDGLLNREYLLIVSKEELLADEILRRIEQKREINKYLCKAVKSGDFKDRVIEETISLNKQKEFLFRLVIIFVYTIYLLIRFIIWAISTLKQK